MVNFLAFTRWSYNCSVCFLLTSRERRPESCAGRQRFRNYWSSYHKIRWFHCYCSTCWNWFMVELQKLRDKEERCGKGWREASSFTRRRKNGRWVWWKVPRIKLVLNILLYNWLDWISLVHKKKNQEQLGSLESAAVCSTNSLRKRKAMIFRQF